MSRLPARHYRNPRPSSVESFAVDHTLDRDQPIDDYLAALVGRRVLAAGIRLLNSIAAPGNGIQPDPRSRRDFESAGGAVGPFQLPKIRIRR